MTRCDTDVLIVGAGAVGLSLAIELGMRGVSAIVVDPIEPRSTDDLRSMRDVPAPRAKLTNIRSMEHARRWGIAERLRDVAPLPRDYPRNILFVTSLTGYTLAKIEQAFGYDGGDPDVFAEGPLQCPQFLVESVLRDRVSELQSVVSKYGSRFVSLTQDAEAVTAEVLERSGSTRTIRARYLVGCDGARSAVRHAIGIQMAGDSALSGSLNIIFRAPDLRERMQKERAIHYWTINAVAPGCCGPLDDRDLWWAVLGNVAVDVDAARALDPSRVLHALAGYEVDAQILDVSPWAPHRLLADAFRRERVFLAGDAAHLHSPFGGHGMNLGIGDAVDIGWKLAAVVAGWGGPGLLQSYEIERRPLARRVIDEATRNFRSVSNAFVRPDLETDTPRGEDLRRAIEPEILTAKMPEFRSAGLVCGYAYEHSPINIADGTPAGLQTVVEFKPNARPGSRAPHRRLADGSSLYDHFGTGFTLLTDGSRSGDAAALVAAAQERGVPMKLVAVGDDRLRSLYEASFVLIRPDQHVAWRSDDLPVDVDAFFDRIRGNAPQLATA